MTIQEAISSGKPFNRKGWEEWLEVHERFIYSIPWQNKFSILLTVQDILATDWEIKDDSIRSN